MRWLVDHVKHKRFVFDPKNEDLGSSNVGFNNIIHSEVQQGDFLKVGEVQLKLAFHDKLRAKEVRCYKWELEL